LPVLTTIELTGITAVSANSGGNITNDGGSPITARGVCWSTAQTPTTTNSKTTDGSGPTSFTSAITGLTPGTTYFVRAYATNSVGTAYGNQVTAATITTPPVLTTTALSAITSTTATSGGNISNDGGAAVTARGVCWNTNANPTISNSKTIDSSGTGIFISLITGLAPGSSYYVRAYATNSLGTTYGNEFTMTTTVIPSTINTTNISSITTTTASSGGNITSDGGAAITAKGVCWSTTTSPTTSNNKTNDGAGSTSFTSAITGLTPGTTYYVKSYASNSAGTAYGNEISFITTTIPPVLSTIEITSITSTTANSGGNITSAGGTITASGICWSAKTNPTIADSKTSENIGSGLYVSNLTGLSAGTIYYVRSYAINSSGTSYGNEISFKTTIVIPVLNTQNITSITNMTAKSGGAITSNGGGDILAKGVCWSNSATPTINNNKTSDGTGNASFISSLTGLSATTTYYARAYATNSAGTGYGNEIQFTTPKEGIIFNPNLTYGTANDIDGNEYKTIKIGTQTWMAENLRTTKYRNGDLIGTTTPATLGISGLDAPKYQWAYNGDESKVPIYGRLYTGFAMIDNRKVCPIGWHVATSDESNILSSYLINNGFGFEGSGFDIAKSLASTFAWNTSTSAGTVGQDQSSNNSSGFTELPSGYRNVDGSFAGLGSDGKWMCPEYLLIAGLTTVRYYNISYSDNSWQSESFSLIALRQGLPIRCIVGEFDPPVLSTTLISDVTQIAQSKTFSVTTGGVISSDGGTPIIKRGVAWSLAPNPKDLTSKSSTSDGAGIGSYTSIISGLAPRTTYYVRAYAYNAAGVTLGNEISITTNGLMPVVTTNQAVETYSSSTALSGGCVENAGDAPLIMRGVCWSTSINPTIANDHTTDGNQGYCFSSFLTGLTSNTTYYIRAYATNSFGTNYGSNVTFLTLPNSAGSGTVTDIDGNVYNTIQIGTQVWMKENLKVLNYNDNTPIPIETNATTWANMVTPGYCWYNNDASNKSAYGALYNWYTVNSKKLCPTGWHVPTNSEWTTLSNYLGGDGVSGGKLKEAGTTHWIAPNTSATNATGFTALPGGYLLRLSSFDTKSTFEGMGIYGNWWSATGNSSPEPIGASLFGTTSDSSNGFLYDVSKHAGSSVRCIHD